MRIGLALLLFLVVPVVHAAEAVWEDRPEWAEQFRERGVAGTALIYDEAANRYLVFDRKRDTRGHVIAREAPAIMRDGVGIVVVGGCHH